MSLSFLSRYFLLFFFGMLIGGRLFHVFEHIAFFIKNPLDVFFIWDFQFSFFGVLYTLLVLLFFITRRAREDFWAWFDAAVLSLIAAMFLIHIGHFFNGTQYGIPTSLPWGIAFDAQNIRFFHPIHPTQLYSSLLSLIFFIHFLKKSKRTHLSGVIGSMALMFYSLSMLGIDFLRATSPLFYNKISFGLIAVFSFISLVHCSHKTYNQSAGSGHERQNNQTS